MKVCLLQEDEENAYRVVSASMNETPYRILHKHHVFYETRDVFLNGQKITNKNILKPLSEFKFPEQTVFISVMKKM